MEKEMIIIEQSGIYFYKNNYELIFQDDFSEWIDNCNITCGSNCVIYCGDSCNIICGGNCKIDCGDRCNITCGNDCEIVSIDNCYITCGMNCHINCQRNCHINCHINCEIIFGYNCYIKAGEGSELKLYSKLIKTILKDEEFIWWYIGVSSNLVNTYKDVDWKENNFDKLKELYPFVHNELDSTTLF